MNLRKLFFASSAGALLVGAAAAQGANDCANAQPISGYGTFNYDGTSATTDGPHDCNGQPTRRDVWFDWTAPVTEGVKINDCGLSPVETRIAVYDGTDCNNLSLLACDSRGCSNQQQSQVAFSVVAGNHYLIRMGNRSPGPGQAGMFVIEQDPCDPAQDDGFEDNDDCASATPLVDGTYPGLFVAKGDFDYYEFSVEDGFTLQIDAIFTHANGDIDMFLLDNDCTSTLDVGGSGSDNETVSWQNTRGCRETVYLKLEHWLPDTNADCNDYDLVVSGTGSSGQQCGGGLGSVYCQSNPNSTGVNGVMEATGSDVLADNDVTLHGSSLPLNATAFFITGMAQGFTANPGGSEGNLCLTNPIGRYVGPGLVLNTGATGAVSLVIDLTQMPTPTGPVAAQVGDTWSFQCWHRDTDGMGGATSNFTDGLEITWL